MTGAANAGEVRARLILDSSQFRERMEEARTEMESFKDGGKTMQADLNKIQNVAAGLGGVVVGVVGASVAAAANFEQSMSRLSAMSGATEDQYKALEEAAIDYGSSTQYSATQAADALTMLSMAGFSVQQSITALPSVLGLAAAGGLELAQASEIAGNVMNGFQLQAEDLGHVVDVLAQAANSSNSGVDTLGESFKYVAPVAKALGYNIEDTTAAIALMSNAGIVGGEAGTALRAALLSLNNPTGQAAEAVEKLGLKLKDQNGNLLPLPKLIGTVSEKLKGMTDSQKTMYAAQLVGTEAASGFLAVLAGGEDGLNSFSDSLRNSTGAAEEMAKTMQDNMMGAWENFTGALEGLGIRIGKEFLPAITQIIKSGTGLVDMLNEVNPQLIATAAKSAGVTAAVALMGVGIMRAVTALKALRLAFISNPVGLAITGISLLAGAVMAYADTQENAKEVTLEHYNELNKQQGTLEKTIQTFENLQMKNKLSSDEMLRYIDIQQELQNTTDPSRIQTLSGAMDILQQKSGLSKDELNNLVRANGELIDQAPATQTAVSENGNAFAKSADQAKALNKELIERKRLELETQQIKAEARLNDDMEKYKARVQDVNEALEVRNEKVQTVAGYEAIIEDLEQKKVEAGKLHGEAKKKELAYLDTQLNLNNAYLGTARNQLSTAQEQYRTRLDEYNTTVQNLQKDQEIYGAINQNIIAAVGLTAERGKEKKVLDDAIKAEEAKKQKLIEQAGGMDKLTAEQWAQIKNSNDLIAKYKDAGGQIDSNTKKQQETKKKVSETKDEAGKLQEELSREAAKKVSLTGDPQKKADDLHKSLEKTANKNVIVEFIKKGWDWTLEKFGIKKHSGGTIPKFHTGGSPAFLTNMASKPKVDEVDARLLDNEMVLTSTQQAMLFNMIRTYNAAAVASMRNNSQGDVSAKPTTINVAELHVREEADIQAVAKELDRLAKQRQRIRG